VFFQNAAGGPAPIVLLRIHAVISKRDLALENPPSPYPHGWYRLALSSEVRHDRLLTVRAFGSEIVLFRDRAGKVSALDAWCPHLGAHLGDGRVVDGEVRCAFHGWCFDSTGRCVSIPHARRIPHRAYTRAWRVDERAGIVFARASSR
jgi:phenylpropionate dioxygenase-like ring-hydroxylating dioxygenase large terminal subunit